MLGSGAFSDVYKGTLNGTPVAIKRLILHHKKEGEKNKLTDLVKAFKDFRYELTMHSQLVGCPSIVGLKGICTSPLSLVLEYVPHGSLYDLLQAWENPFSWDVRLRVLRDIAHGVAFMHGKLDVEFPYLFLLGHNPPIAHLDLKSPNVLLVSSTQSKDTCAKIADFGTSGVADKPFTNRFVDNPTWLAPEILEGKTYDKSVDVYAFGVITWEVLTRGKFFGDVEWMSDIEDWVILGKRPEFDKESLPELEKIATACWAQAPSSRPSISTVASQLDSLRPNASWDKAEAKQQQRYALLDFQKI